MKLFFNTRIYIIGFLFISLPAFVYSQATCATAATLTPSTSCSNPATQPNMQNAANASPTGSCGGATSTTTYGVWYKFTATSTSSTINVTNLKANLTAASTYLEVFTGTCGSFTVVACQNVTSGLTLASSIGTTYYIRVYVTANPTGNPAGKWDFDICVVNPIANDECSGAITLISNNACSNTLGTLISATASTGVPAGCIAGTHYDVWYKFVAVMSIETITFTKVSPSNISNSEIQLFSGTCGALTSLACGTTSISVTSLTVGATYYVRVSQVGGSALTTRGDFNICVRHSSPAPANIDFSKSYVNITKGTGGGTVSPGDILEIRATFVLRSGASGTADSLAFYDTLAVGEGLSFVPGSIALRTNEGKIYKSFTDSYDSDAGWRDTSINNAADTVIQINFGAGATNVKRGSLSNTSKPSVFGSTCIIMATYRVVVTAAYNTTINLGGGELTSLNGGNYSDLQFPQRNVMVYQNPGLCPNALSATNAIGGDFNGTFGTSSGVAPLAKNRVASTNVPSYAYRVFTTSTPGDYFYGITNNTSGAGTNFSTITTWPKPDVITTPSHRVFDVWDITGDHTGASNAAKGNPPCDTTKPVSAANPCGYMLVINSAYKTDTAFTYPVTNLCPSTYYEISAWFKNVCSKCSCDSNGVSARNAGYLPFAPGDSSGVQPNLAFDIDGIDYYTSGNLAYLGNLASLGGTDSTNQWVQRGFTYLTGPTQTSLTLTIRNNAPGGGGNDWAIDDIALKTCSPDVTVTPGPNPFICDSNMVDVGATIGSYFNNYVYYSWEKSTNNGATWTSTGITGGPMSPTWTGSAWSYNVTYPSFKAFATDSGSKYRVVVASTPTNLSSASCRFSGGATITLTVDPCDFLLAVDILSFKGRNENNQGVLYWTTSKEIEPVKYEIQKSKEAGRFVTIGEISGYKDPSAETNRYTYIDPESLDNTIAWYRIKAIKMQDNNSKYSKVVQLIGDKAGLQIESLINPFNSHVKFDLISGDDGLVQVEILDQYQHKLKSGSYNLVKGRNRINIDNTDKLPAGFYILRVISDNNVINRKIIKRG